MQNPGRECEFASGVETHTAGTPHNEEGRRQKKMTSEGHIGAREHEETLHLIVSEMGLKSWLKNLGMTSDGCLPPPAPPILM